MSETISQILLRSRSDPNAMAELERFRRNIAVLFTDIKGSTAYFEKYGDIAGLMMVHDCNNLLRGCAEKKGGNFVKEIGDSIMVFFEEPLPAVEAAIDMQKSLIEFNTPKNPQDHVRIRIGLNYGQGIVKTGDVFGDVVNVASRVESVAQAEQIVISDTVQQQVGQKFKTAYMGRFALKGKEENRDLYEVLWSEDRLQPKVNAAHTVVLGAGAAKGMLLPSFKLQQVRQDGSAGALHELKAVGLAIGESQGDLRFQGDPELAPLHARFTVDRGQVFVEDVSSGRGAFVRLVATYTLQNGDEILFGNQRLRFREQPEAVQAAAATGTTILEANSILNEPVAQLVKLDERGQPSATSFPLLEEKVTLGRTRGTYQFPEDRFMSRTHCEIYHRGENFFLEDAGSRNGTYIRTRGKTPVPLGATVKIGGQFLRVTQ